MLEETGTSVIWKAKQLRYRSGGCLHGTVTANSREPVLFAPMCFIFLHLSRYPITPEIPRGASGCFSPLPRTEDAVLTCSVTAATDTTPWKCTRPAARSAVAVGSRLEQLAAPREGGREEPAGCEVGSLRSGAGAASPFTGAARAPVPPPCSASCGSRSSLTAQMCRRPRYTW